MFCDFVNKPLVAHFETPGKPIIFSVNGEGFESDYVLATLEQTDEDSWVNQHTSACALALQTAHFPRICARGNAVVFYFPRYHTATPEGVRATSSLPAGAACCALINTPVLLIFACYEGGGGLAKCLGHVQGCVLQPLRPALHRGHGRHPSQHRHGIVSQAPHAWKFS